MGKRIAYMYNSQRVSPRGKIQYPHAITASKQVQPISPTPKELSYSQAAEEEQVETPTWVLRPL